MTVTPPRIMFFGMRCPFSEIVLTGLLAGGVDVRAVVLPAATTALPLTLHWPPELGRRLPVVGGGIDRVAAAAGIPAAEIASASHRKVQGWLAAREADLIVVACFPWKLPRRLRETARVVAVNLHPSLLPAGRGPDPLFWTFRHGARRTGVTVHLLDAGYDTGPIVAQEEVVVPDGVRERVLESDLADRGTHLLVAMMSVLTAGDPAAMAQDERLATYAPLPSANDFAMLPDLPARWAYNFARGVAERRGPLRVMVLATGEQIAVIDAVAWEDGARLSQPVMRDGDLVTVQFRPGTVSFVVSPDT